LCVFRPRRKIRLARLDRFAYLSGDRARIPANTLGEANVTDAEKWLTEALEALAEEFDRAADAVCDWTAEPQSAEDWEALSRAVGE
jgi:hypothetical protein